MDKQTAYQIEWANYTQDMLEYNSGMSRFKPRVPFQQGTHIDSLPRERCRKLAKRRTPALVILYRCPY